MRMPLIAARAPHSPLPAGRARSAVPLAACGRCGPRKIASRQFALGAPAAGCGVAGQPSPARVAYLAEARLKRRSAPCVSVFAHVRGICCVNPARMPHLPRTCGIVRGASAILKSWSDLRDALIMAAAVGGWLCIAEGEAAGATA
jgi:hypothetical protein